MICSVILKLGNDEQKQRWLPQLAGGDVLAGFALTEPDAGSDAAGIRATARRTAEGYVLNGRKQWCTNGSFAGVVMECFGPRFGRQGRERVLDRRVCRRRRDREGHRQARHSHQQYVRHGVRRCPRAARLPARRRRRRLRECDDRADVGTIGIAAQATGILAACLDESVAFAKERVAFGRPIGAYEGISFKVAQMAMDLDAARLLVYRAAALADAGKPFTIEASKAKLFASTAARKHAAEALQIHGGYGYTTEFPVERHYRDAKITEIYEGTSEIQQLIIARSLLGNSPKHISQTKE